MTAAPELVYQLLPRGYDAIESLQLPFTVGFAFNTLSLKNKETTSYTMIEKDSPVNNEASIAAYNATVPYQKDVELTFIDFDIIFLGIHDVATDEGAIISLQTTDFKVTSKHPLTEQILKIGIGQLPNPPKAFSIGEKKFTIYTYAGPDGKKLPYQNLLITME